MVILKMFFCDRPASGLVGRLKACTLAAAAVSDVDYVWEEAFEGVIEIRDAVEELGCVDMQGKESVGSNTETEMGSVGVRLNRRRLRQAQNPSSGDAHL